MRRRRGPHPRRARNRRQEVHTHGFSGLAIFDIDVHDNSPAGSVSFTLGGAAIAATLANERDAAADAMEAAPWASCDAYGGTQFNSVTIRRWASVKYARV